MRQNDPWKDIAFANNYVEEASNPQLGWYEHEVNFPSLLSMISQDAKTLLDFGCGPGDYTSQLATTCEHVEGCDTSEVMLDIAKRDHPTIPFFLWDFHDALPIGHGPYDVVLAKLAVQFIEDLDVFAAAIARVLSPRGMVVVSVPHPFKTAPKVTEYNREADYKQQIGTYEIFDTMIHRSIERYMRALVAAGYVLCDVREPQPTPDILERYHVSAQDFAIPKRLNMAFQKI